MTPEERQPTRDELLTMAYVDGELGPDERRELESRMANEPQLVRQVAEYKGLELIARQMAPKEPQDYEWERLARDPAQRSGTLLGFLALAVGLLGLAGWAVFQVAVADIELVPKLLLGSAVGGFTLLFLVVLRARLRLLPTDPYTKVQR